MYTIASVMESTIAVFLRLQFMANKESMGRCASAQELPFKDKQKSTFYLKASPPGRGTMTSDPGSWLGRYILKVDFFQCE
jgi:hypothetical protein